VVASPKENSSGRWSVRVRLGNDESLGSTVCRTWSGSTSKGKKMHLEVASSAIRTLDSFCDACRLRMARRRLRSADFVPSCCFSSFPEEEEKEKEEEEEEEEEEGEEGEFEDEEEEDEEDGEAFAIVGRKGFHVEDCSLSSWLLLCALPNVASSNAPVAVVAKPASIFFFFNNIMLFAAIFSN